MSSTERREGEQKKALTAKKMEEKPGQYRATEAKERVLAEGGRDRGDNAVWLRQEQNG